MRGAEHDIADVALLPLALRVGLEESSAVGLADHDENGHGRRLPLAALGKELFDLPDEASTLVETGGEVESDHNEMVFRLKAWDPSAQGNAPTH